MYYLLKVEYLAYLYKFARKSFFSITNIISLSFHMVLLKEFYFQVMNQ